MNRFSTLPALVVAGIVTSGCVTTDLGETTADFASTTGDAASSASSGTSGGEQQQSALAAQRFVAAEIDWIRRDAAAGGGETIDTLARLLGEPRPAEFGRWARAHYAELFTPDADPDVLLTRIRELRGTRS